MHGRSGSAPRCGTRLKAAPAHEHLQTVALVWKHVIDERETTVAMTGTIDVVDDQHAMPGGVDPLASEHLRGIWLTVTLSVPVFW
jgi:hypothetical protein